MKTKVAQQNLDSEFNYIYLLFGLFILFKNLQGLSKNILFALTPEKQNIWYYNSHVLLRNYILYLW